MSLAAQSELMANRVLASAGPNTTGSAAGLGGSRHVVYLDWLKFLVVYGIVVYHSALPFSYGAWLLGSRDRSAVLTAFTGFTFPWGIPLLFLLSGMGAFFGLRSKTAQAFLRRRFLRLGLPLIAGIILLSPMQAYLTNGIAPKTLGGMLAFYPQFLGSMTSEWTPRWLAIYGYHLWFLGYLLGITALTLPLLEWIRGESGLLWVGRLSALSRRRAGLLVFAAPLVASQVILRGAFPDYQDWADISAYTVVFLAGYVMAADVSFDHAIRSNAGLMVKLGVVSSVAVGLMLGLSAGHMRFGSPSDLAFYTAYDVMWSLNIWCWCVALLALGVRWLNRSNAVVRYGAESALPVYVIHHPVVVILGSFIVGWNLPLWPRFLLLVAGAMVVTLAIYEFGVRRTRPTRFLFGMAPPPRPPVEREGSEHHEPGVRVPAVAGSTTRDVPQASR
jgi:glucans biosynthesis protein C